MCNNQYRYNYHTQPNAEPCSSVDTVRLHFRPNRKHPLIRDLLHWRMIDCNAAGQITSNQHSGNWTHHRAEHRQPTGTSTAGMPAKDRRNAGGHRRNAGGAQADCRQNPGGLPGENRRNCRLNTGGMPAEHRRNAGRTQAECR